jgi:hypothetical protein
MLAVSAFLLVEIGQNIAPSSLEPERESCCEDNRVLEVASWSQNINFVSSSESALACLLVERIRNL